MKKFFLFLVLSSLFLIGCGSDDNKIKVGTIKYLNVSEDTLAQFYEKSLVTDSDTAKCEHIFFDNMNTMVAALQAGQIDIMSTYETVGEYLTAQNQNFEWTMPKPVLRDVFCCAMREEDSALKEDFDGAISAMNADGTLVRLVKTNINGHAQGNDLPAIELPAFYGASTIKIGVTGDLPLLDYIRPDNLPAGFNTAVLAEISRRVGKNFVLVQVDSGARAAALTSGQVDVIFWAVVPQAEGNLPNDIDKPEGVILTVPYFADEIVHVNLRK